MSKIIQSALDAASIAIFHGPSVHGYSATLIHPNGHDVSMPVRAGSLHPSGQGSTKAEASKSLLSMISGKSIYFNNGRSGKLDVPRDPALE